MKKKKIVVVGYPKSGCTWLVRLVAELIQCPVTGFWGEPENPEIAIEGTERQSDFECYKAHHTYHYFHDEGYSQSDDFFFIYIIRDPRDVIVSGARYFFPSDSRDSVCGNNQEASQPYSLMTRAVCHGSQELHPWLSSSWVQHVAPYLEAGVCCIRYEDLLSAPLKVCHQILRYLDLRRSEKKVISAVEKQSFASVRAKSFQKGDKRNLSFLSVGKTNQWKTCLNEHFVNEVQVHAAPLLHQLGYERSPGHNM